MTPVEFRRLQEGYEERERLRWRRQAIGIAHMYRMHGSKRSVSAIYRSLIREAPRVKGDKSVLAEMRRKGREMFRHLPSRKGRRNGAENRPPVRDPES